MVPCAGTFGGVGSSSKGVKNADKQIAAGLNMDEDLDEQITIVCHFVLG